jgi:hypothetical protein
MLHYAMQNMQYMHCQIPDTLSSVNQPGCATLAWYCELSLDVGKQVKKMELILLVPALWAQELIPSSFLI